MFLIFAFSLATTFGNSQLKSQHFPKILWAPLLTRAIISYISVGTVPPTGEPQVSICLVWVVPGVKMSRKWKENTRNLH